MAGKKGRSGRKKSISTLVAEAIDGVDQRLPEILQVLIEKALAGDKECAIYLVDRVLGRPRIEVDQRMKTEIHLRPDEYMKALQQAQESARSMLPGPATSNTQLALVDGGDTAGMSNEPTEKWDGTERGLSRTYEAPENS